MLDSDWTRFPAEFTFLKYIFIAVYPENLIESYFKKFLDNTQLIKGNVPTIQKQAFALNSSILRKKYFRKLGLNCKNIKHPIIAN